jgi:hypothetical protein
VAGLDEAIAHIERYGSHHTDAIVTADAAAAGRFLAEIDSAIVLHNASTQFADGGEFGFGAEIGIATGKMHARGPVGVKAIIPDLGDPQGKVEVEADLSEVELRVQAISWFRPATEKTSATLVYYGKGEKGPRVEDLEIKGTGVSVKGALTLAPKREGLRTAKLSEVRLSEENRFSAAITTDSEGTSISIDGETFDARPLIRSMFGSRNKGDAGDPGRCPGDRGDESGSRCRGRGRTVS